MKICFIGEFPLPNMSPNGGPQNVLFNLTKGIMDTDPTIEMDIITIQNGIKNTFVKEYSPNLQVHYVPSFNYVPRSFGDPIIIKNLLKKNNFDLIHAHYPIVLSKVEDIKIPKILTLHGLFSCERKFAKNPLTRLVYHDYNTYALKNILTKIDGVVAISPFMFKEINKYNISLNKKIYQINNPVDLSFFKYKSFEANNTILYPGTVNKLKNQIAAIKALYLVKKEIEDIKLLFVGAHEKIYFKLLNGYIDEYNLKKSVDFLGKASRTEMLNLYSRASIIELLSCHETQSMVISEAMAMGKAVIASNNGNLPYLVKNGISGYTINQNDSQHIAERTIELLTNDELRKKMGCKAKEMAYKDFNPTIIATQTINMYKEILESYHAK